MAITPDRVHRFASDHLGTLLSGGFRGKFFLAGGCFKSLIHGKVPNDLDLWPASSEDRKMLLDALQSQGSVVLENGAFNTILKHPNVPFRVEVTRKLPHSVEESVADFDIQLSCVAAEYSDGTVGDVYIHAGLADCIADREVRTVSRLRPMKYSLRTLERLDRYAGELGFRVCEKSRRRVWDIYTAAASEEERTELLEAAGLRREDVPPYATIRRVFLDGKPPEPCRPFTALELDAMRRSLVSSCSSDRGPDTTTSTGTYRSTKSPVAVFVVGLPAAGKGTVLNEIIKSLGFSSSLASMANLDMDHIRSFHDQFNRYLRGSSDGRRCTVYKDLIAWFNEGANAERALYKDHNAIIRDVLARKCDFVLPVHSRDSLEFIRYTCSSAVGYVPCLIEVRVPVEVALQRAAVRAKITGRYTPPEYIRESVHRIADFLPAMKEFVEAQSGGMVAVFDNSRTGGGGLGPPVRIY